MATIAWTESMDVGVVRFNEAHRRLLDLINELYTAMLERRGQEAIGNVLRELKSYTQGHFAAEERLMVELHYPGLAAHRAEHEAFVARVQDLQDRFEKGSLGLSIETSHFLKDWLVNHIQGTDKQYKDFFNGLGVR